MISTNTAPTGAVRVIRSLFALSTILFVALGLVIIVGQVLMLIAGQGVKAYNFAEKLGPYAFGTSTVAGLLAFALSYFRIPAHENQHHE